MRNSLYRINSRLDIAEEKISKFEGKTIGNSETKYRRKKAKKWTDLKDNTNWPIICVF